MDPPPSLYLSPAHPAELLNFVADCCTYPSILVICWSQSEFVSSIVHSLYQQEQQEQRVRQEQQQEQQKQQQAETPWTTGLQSHQQQQHQQQTSISRLLSNPLHRVAKARHIRTAFMPTVTHLRAWLSVLPSSDDADPRNPVRPPPCPPARGSDRPGCLVIYGLLSLHLGSSEWSAQGMGETLAAAVEAGARAGLRVMACDPPPAAPAAPAPRLAEDDCGNDLTLPLHRQTMPILSPLSRRVAERVDVRGKVWTGRQVEARTVLGRWFVFEDGVWEHERLEA